MSDTVSCIECGGEIPGDSDDERVVMLADGDSFAHADSTECVVTLQARVAELDGRPWRFTYGTEIEIFESSAAPADHLWLSLLTDTNVLTRQEVGEGTAHLHREQVEKLAAQLRAWLDDHPRPAPTEDAP